jgi:hypothetical protein
LAEDSYWNAIEPLPFITIGYHVFPLVNVESGIAIVLSLYQ